MPEFRGIDRLMKRHKRPFLKQKPILYFDENFPMPILIHFRKGSRWKKKIKVVSAVELGHKGKGDEYHFAYPTPVEQEGAIVRP